MPGAMLPEQAAVVASDVGQSPNIASEKAATLSSSSSSSTTIKSSLQSDDLIYYRAEYGSVAPEQVAEDHYDTRRRDDDDDDDVNNRNGGNGGSASSRIEFPTDKLYGREAELKQLHDLFQQSAGSGQVLFLAGYAGTGKSALVRTFVKQIRDRSTKTKKELLLTADENSNNNDGDDDGKRNEDNNKEQQQTNKQQPKRTGVLYATGKYQFRASDPFSALVDAMSKLSGEIVQEAEGGNDNNGDFLKQLRARLQQEQLHSSGQDAAILKNFIPALAPLWRSSSTSSGSGGSQHSSDRSSNHRDRMMRAAASSSNDAHHGGGGGSNSGSNRSLGGGSVGGGGGGSAGSTHAVRMAFCRFLHALASPERPLVLFLDDLQWADDASLDFIAHVAKDTTITDFVFIGSYRSNEVRPDDAFCRRCMLEVMGPLRLPAHLLLQQQQQQDRQQDHQSASSNEEDGDAAAAAAAAAADDNEDAVVNAASAVAVVSASASSSGEKSSLSLSPDSGSNGKGSHHFEKATRKLSSRSLQGITDRVHHMELFNLSPAHVGQFIADSIGRTGVEQEGDGDDQDEDDEPMKDPEAEHSSSQDVDYFETLTKVIYGKTMGNIFFVMQALEELVRRNALYYDVMTFQWQWGDLERVDLEQCLSQDVVQMVQSKIATLPPALQRALTVAALTRNTIHVEILQAILAKTETTVGSGSGGDRGGGGGARDTAALIYLLDRGVVEGVLLTSSITATSNYKQYTFAHDHIQQAAASMIPPGPERDKLLVQIGAVLVERASGLSVAGRKATTATATSTQSSSSRPPRANNSGGHHQQDHHHHQHHATSSRSFDPYASCHKDNEWMLFVAVHHMNSVPRNALPCILQFAQLNVRVAKLAKAKAAFVQAAELVRVAVRCLGDMQGWERHYAFCLDAYNMLLEVEYTLGNFEAALAAIAQVRQHARCNRDKHVAHYTYVEASVAQEGRNYASGVDKCLEVLRDHYGVHLPPRKPSNKELLMERMRLRAALRGRPLLVLAKLPVCNSDGRNTGGATSAHDAQTTPSAEQYCKKQQQQQHDSSQQQHDGMADAHQVAATMKLLQLTCIYASFIRQDGLVTLLSLRAMRMALQQNCITKHLPILVSAQSVPLRQRGKFKDCHAYANVADALLQRFPSESRNGEFCRQKLGILSVTLMLRRPFDGCIGDLIDLHKSLIAAGIADTGLAAAMLASMCFFAASLPLNSLLEPKLLLFEDVANNMGQTDFVHIFQFMRQFLYNLRGKSSSLHRGGIVGKCGGGAVVQQQQSNNIINDDQQDPTLLCGEAFDEEMVLATAQGNTKKMAVRDVSMFRLQLAFIFDDVLVMEEMLDRLEAFPVFDTPVVRQHLRLAFVGLAGLYLASTKTNYSRANSTPASDPLRDHHRRRSTPVIESTKMHPHQHRGDGGGLQPRRRRSSVESIFSASRCDEKSKKKRYLAMGLTALNHFKKLDKFGSPNARPVYLCLKATHDPKQSHYDEAIRVCEGANLMNLAAIMNERCALFLKQLVTSAKTNTTSAQQDYLTKSFWLYHDWGAMAKVAKMKQQHAFLRNLPDRSNPPKILSSLLKSAYLKGIEAPIDHSDASESRADVSEAS